MMLIQFIKFGIAGLAATLIHVLVVFILVEMAGWNPVLATFPAFLFALAGSYLINHRWTFAAMGEHGRHFPRYAVIAMMGLGLNLLLMALAVNVLHLGYAWGLALVLMVVPLAGFLLQRNWSFTPGDAEAR